MDRTLRELPDSAAQPADGAARHRWQARRSGRVAKHLNLWSTWATEGPLLGPGGHAPSVQEAAYRPRDIAKQRELARTNDQLELQAKGGFRAFVVLGARLSREAEA